MAYTFYNCIIITGDDDLSKASSILAKWLEGKHFFNFLFYILRIFQLT